MNAVLDPAADIIWASVGTNITAEGMEEFQPRTDDEWAAVRNAAVVVTESGNLLMMEGRARDTGDWNTFSQALVEIGARAVEAAEAQDKDAVFQIGGDIYNVCAGCHQQYDESMRNARPQ
jgi:mono/diheme cytochrome c family protein